MTSPSEVSPFAYFGQLDSGYKISRSLRFNRSDQAYLSRTPSSASNRKTFTWSAWVKRNQLSVNQALFMCSDSTGNDYVALYFNTDDQLKATAAGDQFWSYTTDQVFRDPSAWGHIVYSIDVTQSTNTEKVKLYYNGTLIENFSNTTNSNSTNDTRVNSTVEHSIGRSSLYTVNWRASLQLADINFIDGLALTPSDLGEYDDNGVWQPKKYDGNYGTNGYHLKFNDNSSNAALGTDSSGNNNNWTPFNLSVASGTDNDSLLDTPTNYTSDTTNPGGNYYTMNPLLKNSSTNMLNGNLQVTFSGVQSAYGFGFPSGKWYFECDVSGGATIGIANAYDKNFTSTGSLYSNLVTSYSYNSSGQKVEGPSVSSSSYGDSFVSRDIIGVAFDSGAGTLEFYKNGTSQGVAFTGITGTYLPAISSNGGSHFFNFGQRPFTHTPPTDYKALVSTNFSDPTILDGSTAMDVKLWSGNSAARDITGYAFSPDFVWGKSRSNTNSHWLMDTIRGAGQRIISNSTAVEDVKTDILSAFNSDGFTLGTNDESNETGRTYVGWAWDAGETTTTHSVGSISSSPDKPSIASSTRANLTSGFSVVTWTGNNTANATVSHGLNTAPDLVIIKSRDTVTDWHTYLRVLDETGQYQVYLNKTNGSTDFGAPFFNADSNVITLAAASPGINGNGTDYVAYCFSSVEQYSSIGKYIGSGTVDGPYVYTGMRPRWIMFKRTSSTGSWRIHDTERETYNVQDSLLFPNETTIETSNSQYRIDILSNGFKIRNANSNFNNTNNNYFYVAFAEHPFKNSRAR